MAVANSLDGGDATASSIEWDDFLSVLMFYGHLSKDDIMHSSRGYLFAIYQNYVKRACENLGVSSEPSDEDEDGNITLKDSDYPVSLRKIKEEQNKYIEESGITDEEFLSSFPMA